MRFKLLVEMDNDSFRDQGNELSRILRQLALRVENDAIFEAGEGSTVQDVNGISVGEWKIFDENKSEEEPPEFLGPGMQML